jgi:hypothetical protein
MSIANEVVRFWRHIKCPLLLVLFSCGTVGDAAALSTFPQERR